MPTEDQKAEAKVRGPSPVLTAPTYLADREKLREIAARLQSWGESDENINWAYGFESLAASLREEASAIREYLTKSDRK